MERAPTRAEEISKEVFVVFSKHMWSISLSKPEDKAVNHGGADNLDSGLSYISQLPLYRLSYPRPS